MWLTSHVGGHKYAGNVIMYPSGDWYGNVQSAQDVARVIAHQQGGELPANLWRGATGLSKEEQVQRWCDETGQLASALQSEKE